jgi:hypothetical protein
MPLPPHEAGSNEMIAKLIKAGYLRPELQHDLDAITSAIAKMKEDLRSGGRDASQGQGVSTPDASPPFPS